MAPGDLDRLEERHVDDSLRLLPLLDELPSGPCIDVGSGVGLPGIPLAICSNRHWRLLEPRKQRAAFLEEAIRTLELADCEVVVADAAEAAQRYGPQHALATARALAPPADAFALITPLVGPGGKAAVFLGRDAQIPPNAAEWAPGIATMTMDPGDLEGNL